MKTNVILKSSDRNLFDVTIRQNTKNQFLSITDLEIAYEKARNIHGWKEKRVRDILNTNDSQSKIYYLLKERGLIEARFLAFMEMVENEGIANTLKNLNVWKTTGRGENRQVMCDAYIWMLVAMEMNPMLYAKVVIWLTDSLIFNRIKAGDEYLPMNRAISNVVEEPNYAKYAVLINQKVFGKHETGIRNTANSDQLNKITKIESFIVEAIDNGYMTSEDAIINYLKK
jgi:hypothetical protein